MDAAALFARVPWVDAIDAVEAALLSGVASAPPRTAVPVTGGELLLMPAEAADVVGVKVTSVAPGNPAVGAPRVQAAYVLMDAATLTPRALVDGTALTTLRTPAVSAVAVRRLALPAARRLLVVGAGPQAWGHVHALSAVRTFEDVVVVSRSTAAALVGRLVAEGVPARAGSLRDLPGADVVACATTAVAPVLDGSLVADHACVVAVGSHSPDARELDDGLLARASVVVVESRDVALREAGDVVMAIAGGALAVEDLVELEDLVRCPAPDRRGPSVVKTVGAGWQDLAVARRALSARA
nr:ornithine cyclodeaminase family protein [uncultured Pseudokineococcus sp.]